MTGTGHIVRWQAQRGFGFIAPAGGGQQLFFHVRDFRGAEPAEGMAVRFEQIEVGGKGPRAVAVQALAGNAPAPTAAASARPSARRSPARPPARGRAGRAPAKDAASQPPWFAGALLLWAALLAVGTWRGAWPTWALSALAALNALTYASYAGDKRAATRRAWRTPESTLHGLALAGGWPAARWAQQRLRHKSAKPAFQAAYVASVLLHLLVLAALVWRGAA